MAPVRNPRTSWLPSAAIAIAIGSLIIPATAAWAQEESPDEARVTTLVFLDESVTVFLRGDTVTEEDIDQIAESYALDEGARDELLGTPKAVAVLAVRNDGKYDVDADTVRLVFEALTSLDESIKGPRPVHTRTPPGLQFRAKSVELFTVRVLGAKPGWEGLVILQPCRGDEFQDSCEAPVAGRDATFQPTTVQFTVVNRISGSSPMVVALAATGLFWAFILIGHFLFREDQRRWLEPVRDWGERWTIKNNVLPVFGFATAGLAALVAASSSLDRLAGVDLGLFVGLSIFLAGAAGSSVLFARLFQVPGADGQLRPSVLFFWIGLAVSVFAALGILSATGFLVRSMTFLSVRTSPFIVAALVLAGLAVIVFAVQTALYQSSKGPDY